MHHNPKGFALLAVIVISLLVAYLVAVILVSGQRQSDGLRDHSEIQKVRAVNQKIKNILSTVDLCTCNLRDFVRPAGQDIVIQDPPAPFRGEFGYYKLTPDRTSAATLCGPLLREDVVLHTAGNYDSTESLKADQIRITQFTLHQSNVNGLDRYKAKFVFVTSKGQLRAHNTMASPAEIDVFLELAGNTIRQCYRPLIQVSVPAPTPQALPSPWQENPIPDPSLPVMCCSDASGKMYWSQPLKIYCKKTWWPCPCDNIIQWECRDPLDPPSC